MAHFAGYCPLSGDAGPEPFNDDGTFRSNIFYDATGSGYIESARPADPNALHQRP